MDAFSILIAIAATTVAWAVLDTFFAEERRVRKALRSVTAYEAGEAATAEPLLQPFRRRVFMPAGAMAVGLLRRLGPADYRNRLASRLRASGGPGALDIEAFLAIKVGLAAGGFLLPLAAALLKGDATGRTVLIAAAIGAFGFFAPDMWVSSAAERRRTQMRRALPDMLDMLHISVSAGLGFDAAMAKLVKNTTGPLADEFSVMLKEIQAGASRKDALHHLGERIQVPEVDAFILALVQADVFGVSIGRVLQTQASELRTKRRQYAEEQAQKAPVKLTMPLVLCILPVSMLVILGPAIIRIAQAFGMMGP